MRTTVKNKNMKELACKPGSVKNSHSSGMHVTMHLKQPTREQHADHMSASRTKPLLPYLVLLRVGFTLPSCVTTDAVRSYRTISPLPPTHKAWGWRYTFCCTGRGLSPPRRYLALCPVEPGLSSLRLHVQRLFGQLRLLGYAALPTGSSIPVIWNRIIPGHGCISPAFSCR